MAAAVTAAAAAAAVAAAAAAAQNSSSLCAAIQNQLPKFLVTQMRVCLPKSSERDRERARIGKSGDGHKKK